MNVSGAGPRRAGDGSFDSSTLSKGMSVSLQQGSMAAAGQEAAAAAKTCAQRQGVGKDYYKA